MPHRIKEGKKELECDGKMVKMVINMAMQTNVEEENILQCNMMDWHLIQMPLTKIFRKFFHSDLIYNAGNDHNYNENLIESFIDSAVVEQSVERRKP